MRRPSDNSTPTQRSALDSRAREELICGQPPRIPPLKPGELSQEARELTASMRKAVGLPPSDEVSESAATLSRHPSLYGSYADLARHVMNGVLSARDRELAILRNAWLCQAPFEWGEHVVVGKRLAGLTSEDIERVTHGSAAPGWNQHDRALLRAVEELHENAMISEEVWVELSRLLDAKQLIELPILVGMYSCVAYVQNSLRIRLRPDNPGLSAR
jgi:alkylhydroperoxidase family enzyme